MSEQPMVPIFDGHNDALLRLFKHADEGPSTFIDGGGRGHLDLPKAKEGHFAGGMFACFTPSAKAEGQAVTRTVGGYEEAFPPTPEQADALRTTLALAADLFRIEALSAGRFKVARTADEIEDCIRTDVIAATLHIEGAEAIDPEMQALDVLHQAGLRSIGPVWSRPNIFGCGVPFKFPSSPDIGPGLTGAGKALVRACNELKILIDLSHLNEKGFWDVHKLSDAPLVATHSNAHALCRVSRNLTDEQLAAIRESDGMVGLNYAVCFLREDGENRADTPFETLLRHLDYLIEHLGEDRVGLGSDFDGATIPSAIGTAAGLPAFVGAMRAHGYGETLIEKICYRNWVRVLKATWGA
ncbi:MAG: dipeptidase [Alphaproteobacteria bacterium]